MKNKKIWARIGAIFACVLLVGALAIPCFADESQTATASVEPPEPPADGYVPPYGTAIDEFMATLDPRANNRALGTLLSIYNGYGDTRFFDIKTLFSSTMDILFNESYTAYIPVDYNLDFASPDTYTQSFGMNIDNIAIAMYDTESSVPTNTYWFSSGRLDTILYFDAYSCMMDITYTVANASYSTFGLRFNGTYSNDQLELRFNSLVIDGDSYFSSEFYKLDFAFAVKDYSEVHLLPYFASLFNSSYAPLWYWEQVYSPYEFYQGFKKSYNLGYADAERWAYQYGYDAGYTDGYNGGYSAGFGDGETNNLDYQDGYEDGRTDTLNEIDAGQVGRNFLGSAFSVPIDALSSFVIATMPDGTNITILGVLSAVIALSLFIAFLKVYAGG